MPIGFDRGDGRQTFGRQPVSRPRTPPRAFSWQDEVRMLSRESAVTVVQHARVVREAIPMIWTRWETAADERVCPICGPYMGRVWQADEGPQPPLHRNCRCRRVYAFTTWQIRTLF